DLKTQVLKMRIKGDTTQRTALDPFLGQMTDLKLPRAHWEIQNTVLSRIAAMAESVDITLPQGMNLGAALDYIADMPSQDRGPVVTEIRNGLESGYLDQEIVLAALVGLIPTQGGDTTRIILGEGESNPLVANMAALLSGTGRDQALAYLNQLMPELVFVALENVAGDGTIHFGFDQVGPEWLPGDAIPGFAHSMDPNGQYAVYTQVDSHDSPTGLPEQFAMALTRDLTLEPSIHAIPVVGYQINRNGNLGSDEFTQSSAWVAEVFPRPWMRICLAA
ncbi:MAG: hypothetical protein MI747_13775, partial [Desulfobacterales bacterium]|nr:hypothetical protein [Desulfobacterales bacterium]